MFFPKLIICNLLLFVLFCINPAISQSNFVEIGTVGEMIEPNDNETVFYKEVSLSWDGFSIENVFQLQISETKDFDQLILDTLVQDNYMFTDVLENHKEYFWRVRDASTECDAYTFENFHFFKTTNIEIDDKNEKTAIKIIPTHINGKEVLYFDNPDYLEFDITIVSLSSKSQYHHKCSSERKGITTASWPRGEYQITLSVSDNFTQTRDIVLH